MALISIQVANPTEADVTVNAKVAKANQVTALSLDNATNEAYQFLAGGCALISNAAGKVADREEAGHMLEFLGRYLGGK